MITITVNGETITTPHANLTEALREWGYTIGACAVALNETFIPVTDYPQTQLTDGDSMQIVVPMQGG
jgi:sulfur carrier protein